MFAFASPRPRRRVSLTPMIDVVFLLLVFFMLAARFGIGGSVPVTQPGSVAYEGPPRLVTVTPVGVALNGVPLADAALAGALAPLVAAPDDVIVLRPEAEADLQRLIDVMEELRAAGFTRLVVAE